MVFVGDNQFIRIKLNTAFPPINISWSKFQNNFDARWEDMYGEQIHCYRDMIGDIVFRSYDFGVTDTSQPIFLKTGSHFSSV